MAALFMVLFFAFFLVVDIVVRKIQKETVTAKAESKVPSIPIGLKTEDIALPGGLFFDPGHTWAGLSKEGNIQVGIDDFAQNVLGRIDDLKIRKVGDSITKGDQLFSVQQDKRKAEFIAPVDGEIVEVNQEVINNPALIKENPYEKGWIYLIKPNNLADSIKSMLIAQDAKKWIQTEVQRFKDFIAEQFADDKKLGKTLADGGTVVNGIMEHMDDFSWMKLQEEFLNKKS